jgi:multidrug efflux pump subunit AcrB
MFGNRDPDIPVRLAFAVCPWPGVSAAKVEQMVTRTTEEAIERNETIHPPGPGTDYCIRSVTLDGVAYVYVQLAENVSDTEKQFSDINLKLNAAWISSRTRAVWVASSEVGAGMVRIARRHN